MRQKKALMMASVASMIDLFNMDNIRILQSLGYEVQVAANFAFGSITSQERVEAFRQELEETGIKAWDIPVPRSIGDWKNISRSYQMLRELCDREQYSIVHTQSPIGGVVGRLAAKGLRKKGSHVIYTAHGFHFFDGAPKKNWILFYPVEKFLSRYTDILITINQEDYRRAQKFHAKNVCYVPGIGVDVDRFGQVSDERDRLRAEFGFSEQDFVVMSVGQLSRRKNQETIIRAMAQIPDEKIRYLIVGQGEMEEKDRELIRELGLQKRVILAGYRGDIDQLLHMADGFVFPSLQEGLPVALMEAMAAGIPVICSKIRGNTDLVTDGQEGRLADSLDVAGFSEAIMELKEHPDLRETYSRNAREKIQGFAIGRVHEEMERIYRSIS